MHVSVTYSLLSRSKGSFFLLSSCNASFKSPSILYQHIYQKEGNITTKMYTHTLWNAILDKNPVARSTPRSANPLPTSILDLATSILDPPTSILDPHTTIYDHRSSNLDPRPSQYDPRSIYQHKSTVSIPRASK